MYPDEHPDYAWIMSQQPLDRSEFEAALSARKDLGPEMEPALVESFAEKVVAEIRRQQAMNPGPGMSQTLIPAGQGRVQRHNRSYSAMGLAITSMVLAIPLTAIALIFGGPLMGILAWAGIVGINFAAALGNFKFNGPSSN
jgi:hypothetical protein